MGAGLSAADLSAGARDELVVEDPVKARHRGTLPHCLGQGEAATRGYIALEAGAAGPEQRG